MRLIDLNKRCWDGYKQVGMKKKGDRIISSKKSGSMTSWA